MIRLVLSSILFLNSTQASDDTAKRLALYRGLDPTSINQHLAFYELYKESAEGKESLKHAWSLLSSQKEVGDDLLLHFPESVDAFISLINPIDAKADVPLQKEALLQIERLCSHLPNRKLKGFHAKTINEVQELPSSEIELSRALLLSQFDDENKICSFQASLDLMALQLLARVPLDAKPEDKIEALNQLIFFEMGFRFPPHSLYSGKIDRFTFLQHVLESRKGVCLGVSTLYLCIAQRINLPLEIITPPGHIYIRYKQGDSEINIETTLRGVHIPSREYLGVNTRSLAVRSLKEVIGMAHYNHASVWLAEGDFEKASQSYAKAMAFMPKDYLLHILYGSSLLCLGNESQGKKLFEEAKKLGDSTEVSPFALVDDLLLNNVTKDGIMPYFLYVDHSRESILKKKEALEKACVKYPRFRAGLFQLAICWLQLDRPAKALDVLQAYHAIDSNDIMVEFYLAELYFSRYDAQNAWKHCNKAFDIATKAGYVPEALKDLRAKLSKQCQQK
jgi:regulator of sirC expression with transglutaminase-like and TPR domain